MDRLVFLLPVELRRVNHTASTNAGDFTFEILRKPYNCLIYVESEPH